MSPRTKLALAIALSALCYASARMLLRAGATSPATVAPRASTPAPGPAIAIDLTAAATPEARAVDAPAPELARAEPDPGRDEETGESPPPPAGVLEILVRRGGEPVREGWVHLAPFSPAGFPDDPWAADAQEDLAHLRLDAEGRALATGLTPSSTYTAVVETANAGALRRTVRIPEGSGERVVIELGAARVYGTIHAGDGQPVAGAAVESWQPKPQVVARALSDASGRYELVGLPPGVIDLRVLSPGEEPRTASFTLRAGEVRRLDFGASDGLAAWTGVVRDAAGQPVPPRGQRAARIGLTAAADGVQSWHALEPDGSFEIHAPAGTYRVELEPPCSATGKVLVDEALALATSGLARDLVVPGATVRGRVTLAATGALVAGGGSTPEQVSLLDGDKRWVPYSTAVAPDGSYALVGVGPGKYFLQSWPLLVPAPIELDVGEGDVVLDVDLVVGPR